METKELIAWIEGLERAAERIERTDPDEILHRTRVAFLVGYIQSAKYVKELLSVSSALSRDDITTQKHKSIKN